MSRLWRPVSLWEQSRREPLSRRTVLRGLFRGAVVSVALPPLEAFFNSNGTAYACGGVIPRRFGLFFWGNGNLPERWNPKTTGTEWEVTEQLAPLADLRSLVTVVTGMTVKVPHTEPHTSGQAGWLAGGQAAQVGDGWTMPGPTIDQLIAAEIGNDSLYRSIQTSATNFSGVSYNGPSSQNPAETSPWALYERLFGASFRKPGEEGVVDPTLALRQSVLDAVMDDVATLQGRVGAADQQRLEQHLEGIRELEQRLAQLQEDPPNLESCGRPTKPLADYPDQDGRPQIAARSRAMADMLAMAFACDLTRVFAHHIDGPVDDCLFPGASAGHHSLTHDESPPQDEVHAIVLQCIEEYAYLVRRFAEVPEADGTLLDNCALLCTSEVSEGRTHSLDEMPVLLAGNACGTLRQGIHHRSYSQENASKVMLTLLRSMDIPAASYGSDEAYTDQSLSEIEV